MLRLIFIAGASIFAARIAFGWANPGTAPPEGTGGIAASISTDGSLGIGTSNSANALAVSGGASIGAGITTLEVPPGVLVVQSKMGIGIGAIDLENNLTIAGNSVKTPFTIWDGSDEPVPLQTGPGFLVVQGKIGIGTPNPVAKLDVMGGMRIGATPQQGAWKADIPMPIVHTTLRSLTGGTNSLAATIGTDGFPIVAYQDSGGLKMVKCVSIDCETPGTPISLDFGAGAGAGVSVVVDANGFPNFSYYEGASLKFLRCRKDDCLGQDRDTQTLSSVSVQGAGTSITIGSDGLPIVSFHDGTDLKTVKCIGTANAESNPCSIVSTPLFIDGNSINAAGSSLAIGADRFPIISYYKLGSGLRVAKCSNSDCSLKTLATVEAGVTVTGTMITMGGDGLPVVFYSTSAVSDAYAKIAWCRTFDCKVDGVGTNGPLITLIDSVLNISISSPVIAISTDGLPFLAYESGTVTKTVKCNTASCASSIISRAPVTESLQETLSLAIGADGVPIIFRLRGGALDATHCGNPRCIPYWTRR